MDHDANQSPAVSPQLDGRNVCFACGYALDGLPSGSVCPECGAPGGAPEAFLIKNSDPAYQRTLLKGVSFVLNGIIAMILMVIIGVIVSFTVVPNNQNAALTIGALDVGLQLVGLLIGLAIAFGWWLFSEADPNLTGGNDGGSPRQIVRVCVVISVVSNVLSFSLYLVTWVTGTSFAGGLALGGVGLISGLAGIVAFFAQMLYVRWLAPRLPNAAVYKRAKTLMWLGPVLYTVGLLLLGLGPLIALVLYWNMLDKVRKDLKTIVAEDAGGFPTAV